VEARENDDDSGGDGGSGGMGRVLKRMAGRGGSPWVVCSVPAHELGLGTRFRLDQAVKRVVSDMAHRPPPPSPSSFAPARGPGGPDNGNNDSDDYMQFRTMPPGAMSRPPVPVRVGRQTSTQDPIGTPARLNEGGGGGAGGGGAMENPFAGSGGGGGASSTGGGGGKLEEMLKKGIGSGSTSQGFGGKSLDFSMDAETLRKYTGGA